MRRILCLAMVCILASVFVSASNVSALRVGKIVRTQWLTSGILRLFDPTGAFVGASAGGDGIMFIAEVTNGGPASNGPELQLTGANAFLVTSMDPSLVVVGSRVDWTLSATTYNARKNLLKGAFCTIDILDPVGNPIFSYMGPCDARIKFTSARTFKGTVIFDDTNNGTGFTGVIEVRGELLGQTPPLPAGP